MPKKINVLLATRAIESGPFEGGFVVLSDLAKELSSHNLFETSMFAVSRGSTNKIKHIPVFSDTGWNSRIRVEFLIGLLRNAHKFDIVHTAHIPTSTNTLLIRLATYFARRHGTRFIQTVTGLPKLDLDSRQMKKLLWGDVIICQTRTVASKIKSAGKKAILVTPRPSPQRLLKANSNTSNKKNELFSGRKKVILFPGEFERLGVDASFAECIARFFKDSREKSTAFVLACRFDEFKTGEKLESQFPDSVINLGHTNRILDIIKASDLIIYPVKKMDSKFSPPLVLMEALGAGKKVLTTELIEFETDKDDDIIVVPTETGWQAIGELLAKTLLSAETKYRPESNEKKFATMCTAYEAVYSEVMKADGPLL